jgi:tight adherence protein C
MKERVEHVLDPLSKALPKSPSEVSATRALLMQAGYREDNHLTVYFGIRALLAIGALVVVLVTGLGISSPLFMIALPLGGYMLPRFQLKRLIRKRQLRIRLGLPDALDLTVICVEAGLGLDQALMRVGEDLRHAHPDLSDEFRLVNLELRAGKARAEALRNLSERTGVDDMRALVAVLIQSDRFAPVSPKRFACTRIPCGRSAASGPRSKPQRPPSKWCRCWFYSSSLPCLLSA